jgi:hypothetical protein
MSFWISHAGFMLVQSNIRKGKRLSMSTAFLEPARGRDNLHIVVKAMADKVRTRWLKHNE